MEIKPEILDRAYILHEALEYRDRGWSVMPLLGKRPALSSWKELQEQRPTLGILHHWFGVMNPQDYNLGIITGQVSDLVVVDADSPQVAAWWRSRYATTPLACRTARGLHFYYRHPGIEIRNRICVLQRNIDIRGDGGYVVAPPSIHPETRIAYEWLDSESEPWQWCLDDIPVFDPDWIAAEVRSTPASIDLPTASVDRARRYIARIVAISGQGGHNATFRAACKIADMGFSEDQMMQLMLEWNETNAKPKWTEAEIRHKVEDALRRNTVTAEDTLG
jgi:hypothetical protein